MPTHLDLKPSPSLDQVRRTLKRALHDPDPFERASAVADLTVWRLPATPAALVIAAERVAEVV